MKSKRGAVILLICLMILAICPIQVFAAGKIHTDKDVTLNISYTDEGVPLPGAQFCLYKAADVDEYARMTLTKDFEPYKNVVEGLSDFENMDQDKWLDMAATLKGYVQADELTPAAKGLTDENGSLTFTVKPGLYLLIGYRVTMDDFFTYSVTPYMIFLPGEDSKNNDWSYDVTTFPKFEKVLFPEDDPDPYVTRKALKIWDDEGYESIRPDEITVHLLRDGEKYDTAVLNAQNNWRCAWDNLSAFYEWTVIEDPLQDYAVTIIQNGITFTVTNKYVVPITGANPPVQKRITGDTPKTDSTFIFNMTAKDSSCPMPEGSKGLEKEISIRGAGSVEFGEITFTKPGTYVYTVSEKAGNVEGYTYDGTVYTLTFEVEQEDGELSYTRTITDNKGNAATAVEFTNKYKTPGGDLPQTGMLWWPVPMLLFAGIALVTAGVVRRKRCDG